VDSFGWRIFSYFSLLFYIRISRRIDFVGWFRVLLILRLVTYCARTGRFEGRGSSLNSEPNTSLILYIILICSSHLMFIGVLTSK